MDMTFKRLQALLPVHLQDDRRLYLGGVIVLCGMATVASSISSPHQSVRVQCLVTTLVLLVLFWRFLKGASAEQTVRIGCMLALVHLTGGAFLSNHIYASSLAWLALMPLSQFHIHGRAAALRWTLVAVASMGVVVLFSAGQGAEAFRAFGVLQAPTSLSEYFLAAIGITVVPWIYSKSYEEALTQSRQHQLDLQAKQVELEHAQQGQEHFIASVSHELRTPMNAILGLNNLLLDRVKDKPQASKVLAYTRQSADHLMTVINDVLDYSQFNTGQISARVERFALRQTVRSAFELFQPKIENTTLRYTCEIGADVPEWVSTDRHRLMQVLVNLLGNAIKFTHQGGVTLQVRALNGGVEFAIQDTGIGIASDQQQKIFERFSQADASIQSRYGGSGLGLTISQRLVQMLGGQLQLESHEGAGSRFWFWLPLGSEPEPERVVVDAGVDRQHQDRALSMLVVDDHPVNRLLARQLLQQHWPMADIQEAGDGQQALACLARQGFDLVLMDMVMPVMDGIEATAAMRASADARTRQTPVLGLTANVNAGDLVRFEQAGLNGLLLKPFEVARLYQNVQALVAHLPIKPRGQT
ncbi:ATP-binding protein [Limnohabitans sp. 2KL-17]|uniref:ATP-binding protein n=1 Tax=Limnohabitans sp. 2KL-17 TaxID=1100704 RepID=UPI001304FFBA|nr:ATP-binding protein [Limnohabitans sp. 2KL-17]